MKKIIIFIVSFFLLISSSQALEIGNYKDLKKNNPGMLESYLTGLYHGLLMSNSWADGKKIIKNKKMFCIPGELTLNNKNLMSFIEEQHQIDIKRNITNIDKQPVAILLIHRLSTVFPCK